MTTVPQLGGPPAPEPPSTDRLDSWKEIAAHLRRAERTVRRWEQTEGLPVYRHAHHRRSSIYAYKPELDAWWHSRQVDLEPNPGDNGTSRARRHLRLAIVAVIVGGVGVAGLLAMRTLRSPTSVKAPEVRSLTAYQGFETAPSFSPDGTRLAFVWNGAQRENFDIYVKLVDDSTPLRLTTNPAPDYSPVWSPDGRFIAFLRARGGSDAAEAEILVIPSLGGTERRVATAAPGSLNDPLLGWIAHLAWSHDGRSLIVSDADTSNRSRSLYEVSTITGEKRSLTRPPPFSMGDGSPSVSPDGRILAFVRSPTIASSDIYLMALASQSDAARLPRRVTVENGYLYNPMWTADGRELLYVTYLDGNTVIKRVAIEGTAEPRVVFTVGQWGTSAAISPRGDRLVYAAATEDLDIAGVALPVSSERIDQPRRIISSTRTDMSPQISPDGRRVAFASRRSGPMEIWVADRDGANAVRLTSGLLYSGAPRWSPDGQTLVFGSVVDGNDDIFTVSASGGAVRRITDNAGRDVVASWSRDGRSIYFASNRSGTFEIWKTTESGGTPRQITNGGGYGGFESTDGRYFYYAKNNGPTSLWRVPADAGDEQPVLAALHRWSHFAVFDDGIYFVPSITVDEPSPLRFYGFNSGTIRDVRTIQAHTAPGLTISPDRAWVLYVVHERGASDLMLLERFR